MKSAQHTFTEEARNRVVDVQDIVNSVVALNDAIQMAADSLGHRHQANALQFVSRCISERLDKIDELLDALLADGSEEEA